MSLCHVLLLRVQASARRTSGRDDTGHLSFREAWLLRQWGRDAADAAEAGEPPAAELRAMAVLNRDASRRMQPPAD